jgi:hypothetical protein
MDGYIMAINVQLSLVRAINIISRRYDIGPDMEVRFVVVYEFCDAGSARTVRDSLPVVDDHQVKRPLGGQSAVSCGSYHGLAWAATKWRISRCY